MYTNHSDPTPPNAVVFMGDDGLYLALLDETFSLKGSARAFDTEDGYYNDLDETQLAFVDYDVEDQSSYEIARYSLKHEDGDDAATVIGAIENDALQSIIDFLINDFMPKPTLH